MSGDPLVAFAVLAVSRRASEPVAPPQVDQRRDEKHALTSNKILLIAAIPGDSAGAGEDSDHKVTDDRCAGGIVPW